MKRLLAMALVLMVAGGAMAQNYNYDGCDNRIGVFFAPTFNSGAFEPSSEATNFNYAFATTFYMHLLIIDAPSPVSAYELTLTGVPSPGAITTYEGIPGTGFTNIGTTFMHIAAFGFPQPNPGNVVNLGAWAITMLLQDTPFQVAITPSTPSSIGGDGPAIVINQELWRPNFTPANPDFAPGDYSGCNGDLAPGMFPEFVGTTFGAGVQIEPVIAVENQSLSNVKALFR